ncbi:MAG: transcriptional regulator [Anaerolineales bacterium]|nr:transcriptional regulator [Anaerolineales bacterium]
MADYRKPALFDRIIHQPSRLAIMAILAGCEAADFRYLMNETGLTKGTLSKHLSRLEDAGYLSIKKTFRGKYPHTEAGLTTAGRKAFQVYRRNARSFLDEVEDGR